jgi:hypothetical protein
MPYAALQHHSATRSVEALRTSKKPSLFFLSCDTKNLPSLLLLLQRHHCHSVCVCVVVVVLVAAVPYRTANSDDEQSHAKAE